MLTFLDCFTDGEAWDKFVGEADPHFSSSYYRAFGGGTLALLIGKDAPLVGQPFRYQGSNWIGNAYNFGGPIGDYRFTGGFAYEFDAWKAKRSLNERCTLVPFMEQGHEAMERQLMPRPVVYVDLALDLKLRQTTRHAIKKSIDCDVVVQTVDPTPENASTFEEMYNNSMTRLRAAAHWFYAPGFFYKVLHLMGPERAALFFTKWRDRVQGGCIVIFNKDVAYYHWAARVHASEASNTDHLQVFRVIEWARTKGIKKLMLGGGIQGNDRLLTFKAGFSSLRLVCNGYVTKAAEREVA